MAEKSSGQLKVVYYSDLMASCCCEDFQRHAVAFDFTLKSQRAQTLDEVKTRVAKIAGIRKVSEREEYSTRFIELETDGKRRHTVMISQGDGESWVCKHILKVLLDEGDVLMELAEGAIKVNNVFWRKFK